jgi:hypothetical protein
MYLEDCNGCQDCIGCINLTNQKYHILNVPHSKEEYFAKKKSLKDHNALQKFLDKKDLLFQQERVSKPRISGSENCSGNQISHSKNVYASRLVL